MGVWRVEGRMRVKVLLESRRASNGCPSSYSVVQGTWGLGGAWTAQLASQGFLADVLSAGSGLVIGLSSWMGLRLWGLGQRWRVLSQAGCGECCLVSRLFFHIVGQLISRVARAHFKTSTILAGVLGAFKSTARASGGRPQRKWSMATRSMTYLNDWHLKQRKQNSHFCTGESLEYVCMFSFYEEFYVRCGWQGELAVYYCLILFNSTSVLS